MWCSRWGWAAGGDHPLDPRWWVPLEEQGRPASPYTAHTVNSVCCSTARSCAAAPVLSTVLALLPANHSPPARRDTQAQAQSECDSDINGSGAVGVDDLLALLASYGSTCIIDASAGGGTDTAGGDTGAAGLSVWIPDMSLVKQSAAYVVGHGLHRDAERHHHRR